MAHPVRRRLLVSALLLLAAVGVAAGILASQVLATRDDLVAARRAAVSALEEIRSGALDRAADDLAVAEARLRETTERSANRLWNGARDVPVVGPSIRTIDDVTATALAAVDLGDQTLAIVRAARDQGMVAGRVPLEPLRQLQAVLDGGPHARLLRARDDLATDRGWVPGELRAARAETLEVVDELVRAVQPVRDAATLLPALLGADEPRRYLLAMQNSAELRGTGGLIGFQALLTVAGGRLRLSDVELESALEVPPGTVTLPAELADRYAGLGVAAGLVNANLDPDFPTSGRVVAEVYEAATGTTLDGVIAIDPVGLALLLADQPPLRLPAAVRDPDGRLPDHLAADELARVLLIDAYEVLGGDSAERKAYHAAVAAEAFDRLDHLAWGPDLLDAMGAAVAGRHLQVFSAHDDEQAVLDRLGASGRLAAAPDHDLLAVTANNAGGNKQDVHVRHAIAGRIVLTPEPDTARQGPGPARARRDVHLEVGVDNPLPTHGRDDYILATYVDGQGRQPHLAGTNRTWFTIWAPGSTRVTAGTGADGPLPVAVDRLGARLAVDHLLDTPAEASARFAVELGGPVELERRGGALVYRLTLWRQSKAIADHLDLTLAAGDGWVVHTVGATGRSDADALGFGETAVPLEAVVDDGAARVTGTATGDVQVEVVLVRAATGR